MHSSYRPPTHYFFKPPSRTAASKPQVVPPVNLKNNPPIVRLTLPLLPQASSPNFTGGSSQLYDRLYALKKHLFILVSGFYKTKKHTLRISLDENTYRLSDISNTGAENTLTFRSLQTLVREIATRFQQGLSSFLSLTITPLNYTHATPLISYRLPPLKKSAAAPKSPFMLNIGVKKAPTRNLSKAESILHKISQHHFNIPLSFSEPMNFRDDVFLANLESYLIRKGRHEHLSRIGYCSGLSLMWMFFTPLGLVNWFYNTKYLIWKGGIDLLDFYEKEVNLFFKILSFWQDPENHVSDIQQYHLEKIFDLPSATREFFVGTKDQLTHKFSLLKPGDLTYILSGYPNVINHVVGFFFNGRTYSLFDTKYRDGKAKEFYTLQSLVDEIVHGLKKGNLTLFPLHIATVNSAAILEYQNKLKLPQPTAVMPCGQTKLNRGL